jgi:hypothetical protein
VAVEVFAGPAVGYVEIFIHVASVSLLDGLGKGWWSGGEPPN